MDASAVAGRPSRPRLHLIRDIILALMLAAAGPATVLWVPHWTGRFAEAVFHPDRAAVRAAVRASGDPDLDAAYALGGFRPLWLAHGRPRPEAKALVDLVAASAEDGLDPARYRPRLLRALIDGFQGGSLAAVARADVQLSSAFADYAADLHRPLPGAEITFTDAAAAPPDPSRRRMLLALVSAPTLGQGVAAVRAMSPIYLQYRQSLALHRSQKRAGGPDQTERLLLANLERARALPANLGRRYLLVDTAAQQLRLYDNGRIQGAMRVIVGEPTLPTPVMAGVIRYAVLNPYWNVPPDLTRDRFAPRAAADPEAILADRMEVLSAGGEGASPLDPTAVDWAAVHDGRLQVSLRQLPGPGNMMGRIKFMLPNSLGIYLHDTPQKTLFGRGRRTFSAGCVRLQDPEGLALWLFGRRPEAVGPSPEQRVDLPAAVPVYIIYFTAAPTPGGGVSVRPDVYGRDPALLRRIRVSG